MLTLKKVKEMVKAPAHTKRVPSPKVLLEEGRIFLRKEFEHGSHLTLYHNGYVWFSAGKRNTVFHIHDCRGDYGVMSNVRFDELELMLMAMFEQPTLRDTIQVLTEIQPLVAEDAEMAALVQQTIPKMQRLTEPQFKGLELEWYRPEDDARK